MRSRFFRSITIASLASVIIGAFIPLANVLAAENKGGQALEIAPPVMNVSANPGQSVTAQLDLRDVSDGPLIVTSQINDFVAGGEDGTPKILMNQDDSNNPYSLKQWIVPLSQLTLQPHQIKKLPVTINVPAGSAPGGYYAVVRFTATPPELKGTGVSLSASLGALVLLTVKGKAKEGMSIAEFATETAKNKPTSLFESTPLNFLVRLKNSGNVHEQPGGQVTVTDMFGKTVGAVNVNMPPRNVLPRSIRRFDPSFDKSVIGNKVLFGLYTAKLHVTYGESSSKYSIDKTIQFWVIPYKLIGGIILALIILFFVFRTMIKRYNRHIINQSQRRRR